MSVTRKFIIIYALGLPLMLLAVSSRGLTSLFLAYNAVCAALFLVDYFITPKVNVLSAIRDNNDKLYFKTENTVTFTVRNNYPAKLYVELKDEIPDWHFNVVSRDLSGYVQAFEERVFSYDMVPTKRGSFPFEKVHVKYRGVMGLCQKYGVLNCQASYKVYPNLKDLGRYRLAMQKRRLLRQGERRVKIQGVGSEFESLREYVEGDDYRKINWMATAREDKLIVNRYEAEKNRPVFILIDTGRPMSYSVKGYKKLDYAINAALILSDIVNRQGDQSGLVVFDTEVKAYIPPGKGEAHRNSLMETMYGIEDTKNTSDYEGAFRELNMRQKRRGLAFIFTDFETRDEAEDFIAAIKRIARRQISVVVLMKNESLLRITGKEERGIRETFDKALAMDFLDERRKIIRTLNANGIVCVESSAEDFALSAVNNYLNILDQHSQVY